MAVYDIGDVARCEGEFYYIENSAKVYFDPTLLTFMVKNPSGTITEYIYGTDAEVVKSATGKYYVDVLCDLAGRWMYRYECSGTRITAEETNFTVLESEF